MLFTGSFSSFAQEVDQLPKGLTELERELLPQFQFTSNRMSDPPTGPVRAAAEWEEVEYLVVRWTNSYKKILKQIVEVPDGRIFTLGLQTSHIQEPWGRFE